VGQWDPNDRTVSWRPRFCLLLVFDFDLNPTTAPSLQLNAQDPEVCKDHSRNAFVDRPSFFSRACPQSSQPCNLSRSNSRLFPFDKADCFGCEIVACEFNLLISWSSAATEFLWNIVDLSLPWSSLKLVFAGMCRERWTHLPHRKNVYYGYCSITVVWIFPLWLCPTLCSSTWDSPANCPCHLGKSTFLVCSLIQGLVASKGSMRNYNTLKS
jgi:hypothetical protein